MTMTMTINESARQRATDVEAIDHCMALFFEADRLNDRAYALLSEPISPQIIHKFSEAKKCADEKHRQAMQEWKRLTAKTNR